jgi:hypothetical protein
MVLAAGCAVPLHTRVPAAPASPAALPASVTDLRSSEWKTTRLLSNSQGVVQHFGDNSFPGGSLPAYLAQRLAPSLATAGSSSMTVKTVDVRLSLPNAKLDDTQVLTAVAMHGPVAAPIFQMLSTTARDKSASAVICVAVDGNDYLGNDARLFRFGPEGELRDAIDAAVALLGKNIAGRVTSDSVACQPGWEGGQPRDR